jgi:hypothetical protein
MGILTQEQGEEGFDALVGGDPLSQISDLSGASGLTSFFAGLDAQDPEAEAAMPDTCPRFEADRELQQAQIEAMEEGPQRTQEIELFKAKYHIDVDLSASGKVRAEAQIIENPSN